MENGRSENEEAIGKQSGAMRIRALRTVPLPRRRFHCVWFQTREFSYQRLSFRFLLCFHFFHSRFTVLRNILCYCNCSFCVREGLPQLIVSCY